MIDSAFAKFQKKAWPIKFSGAMIVPTIAGGTPTDPKVAEGWIKTKLGSKDELLQEQVAQTILERGGDLKVEPGSSPEETARKLREEAIKVVNESKHLNGFKRDFSGLYIEGRQLKAALKEAVSVAVAAGKLNGRGWGTTNKGLQSFVAEHVHVVEDRLHLGVTEATGIMQRFVHTFRGTGIQYEEYVENAEISFTVETDHPFTEEQWALIWLTGERQGIGASRSQGFGKYTVTKWEQMP
jgi:hypothetical protein